MDITVENRRKSGSVVNNLNELLYALPLKLTILKIMLILFDKSAIIEKDCISVQPKKEDFQCLKEYLSLRKIKPPPQRNS